MESKNFTDLNDVFFSDDNIVTKTSFEAINNSLSNILLTKKGEKLGDPDFGINLDESLFSQMDNITETILYNDIYDSISKYEQRIEIKDINIEGKPDDNIYYINIEYIIIAEPDNIYKYTTIIKRL